MPRRDNQLPAVPTIAIGAGKTVLVWYQRSSHDPENQPVVWDYHVVVLLLKDAALSSASTSPAECSSSSSGFVLDLDSVLPVPFDAASYFDASLQPDRRLPKRYAQRIRLVPAVDFIAGFASDRRHMKTPVGRAPPAVVVAGAGAGAGGAAGDAGAGGDGDFAWSSPPPVWPCVQGPGAAARGITHNLDRYWDMGMAGGVVADVAAARVALGLEEAACICTSGAEQQQHPESTKASDTPPLPAAVAAGDAAEAAGGKGSLSSRMVNMGFVCSAAVLVEALRPTASATSPPTTSSATAT